MAFEPPAMRQTHRHPRPNPPPSRGRGHAGVGLLLPLDGGGRVGVTHALPA